MCSGARSRSATPEAADVLETHLLKTFVVVARLGHLTRAAEQLHLSQPAVSKQLRALEETLGVRLFDRLPSGMVLSRAGHELLADAERLLEQAQLLEDRARRLHGEVFGQVRLGTIIDPEYLRLGPFLGRLLVDYPRIDVKLQHGISGWVLEQIAAGSLDAGFCLGDTGTPDLAALQVALPIYRVVGPASWAPRIGAADWNALATLPWVGTPRRSSQHYLTTTIQQQHGLQFNFVVEADQESSMIDLMRTGVGLCLMREDLARQAQERSEVAVWDGVRQPCPLSLVYPAARSDDPVIGALLTVLRRVWQLEPADGVPSRPLA
jgi:DNA-binding transcriptional LysR family regulator